MPDNALPCPHCQSLLRIQRLSQGEPLLCPHCNTRLILRDANPDSLAWYLVRESRDRAGPFSWTQLRQLAAQGMLRPTDLLWRTGMRRWAPAGAVPGLVPLLRDDRPAAGLDTVIPTPEEAASVLDNSSLLDSSPLLAPGRSAGPLSMRGMRSRPRSTITLGDFQILKKLGSGAMGAVYLAQQRSMNRLIALKVLSQVLAAQPAYAQRFFREAEVMSRLDHPNIVRFYGVGEEKNLHYFAMEFIDGFTLASVLDRRGGRLAVGDALHVTIAVARALAFAHAHHVVHRDVKPTNVMVSRLGYVKITDLGLAKPLDEDVSLTASGAGIGTPQYMAPEQAHNAKRADPRSDIYALGGVLYQMLTGALPFQGESAVALMMAKQQGRFPSARRLNAAVPDRLDLIIDKMLAQDLRQRYRTCDDLIRDLEGLGLAGEHLSFNPLHAVTPLPLGGAVEERVEILLIEDDTADILLAQEALEKNNVPSNLTVLGSPSEALAFLRRQGKYASAPRPSLIILGRNLLQRGGLETIAAVKADAALRDLPLIVLTTSADADELFAAHGVEVGVKFTRPADLEQLPEYFRQPVDGSTVVLVQLPQMRKGRPADEDSA